MANDENDTGSTSLSGSAPTSSLPPARPGPPAWAQDLRTLYDAVVEEPLPGSFLDLLARLDDEPEAPPESRGPA